MISKSLSTSVFVKMKIISDDQKTLVSIPSMIVCLNRLRAHSLFASHCMCAIKRFGGQKVAKTNIDTNTIQIQFKHNTNTIQISIQIQFKYMIIDKGLIVCLFPTACVPSSGLAVRKLQKQISLPSFMSFCFSSAFLSL